MPRATSRPAPRFDGPALIAEDETTTVVPAAFTARVDAARLHVALERSLTSGAPA